MTINLRSMKNAGVGHTWMLKKAASALLCIGVLLGTAGTASAQSIKYTFAFSGAAVNWTVPVTGAYQIKAVGGSGGFSSTAKYPNSAATAVATFQLSANDKLQIVVGGVGGMGTPWLTGSTNNPQSVSGGGGSGTTQTISSTNGYGYAGGLGGIGGSFVGATATDGAITLATSTWLPGYVEITLLTTNE